MASDLVPAQPSRGRPTAFTPERAEKFLQAVRGGNYLNTSCQYAGIHYATFRRWILKAEQPDAPPDLVEFRDAVEKAMADAEVAAVATVRKAGNDGSWQAMAWWLERTRPEKYGKSDTQRVEIIGSGDGMATKSVGGYELNVEGMAALAGRLHARRVDQDQDIVDAEIIEDLDAEFEDE